MNKVIAFFSMFFVLLLAACGGEDVCEGNKDFNWRIFSVLSPSLPSETNPGRCAVPENPAALLALPNNDIMDIFTCSGLNIMGERSKWILLLDVTSTCTDDISIFVDKFGPDWETMATCDLTDEEEMSIAGITDNQNVSRFRMCPEVYRPENLNMSDYIFYLSIDSPLFQTSNSNSTCSSCEDGEYYARLTVREEFMDVGISAASSCGSALGLSRMMVRPFLAVPDCA